MNQCFWHNKTLSAGCKDDNSSYLLVVEDVLDREVIILKIFPFHSLGTVLENARWSPQSSSLSHI